MNAKKKAIIAIITGAAIGIAFVIFAAMNAGEYAAVAGQTESELILSSLYLIPCFMLYAFGYAFGWKRCKGFLAGAARVSADVTFIYLIVHLITGKGIGKGLMIAMVIFAFAVGIVWLPGIVFGIKDLLDERNGTYA